MAHPGHFNIFINSLKKDFIIITRSFNPILFFIWSYSIISFRKLNKIFSQAIMTAYSKAVYNALDKVSSSNM